MSLLFEFQGVLVLIAPYSLLVSADMRTFAISMVGIVDKNDYIKCLWVSRQ